MQIQQDGCYVDQTKLNTQNKTREFENSLNFVTNDVADGNYDDCVAILVEEVASVPIGSPQLPVVVDGYEEYIEKNKFNYKCHNNEELTHNLVLVAW